MMLDDVDREARHDWLVERDREWQHDLAEMRSLERLEDEWLFFVEQWWAWANREAAYHVD